MYLKTNYHQPVHANTASAGPAHLHDRGRDLRPVCISLGRVRLHLARGRTCSRAGLL
jgi:hypothetical protein